MTISIPIIFLAFTSLTTLVFLGMLALQHRRFQEEVIRRIVAIEDRLGTLERTVEDLTRAERSPAPTRPGPISQVKPSEARRGFKRVTTTRLDSAATPGRTLIAVPDLTVAVSSNPTEDMARRYGSIWDLAEAGASPESIARDTGQPIGQVELILGLKSPRAATGGSRS
jgi:hypothetical protein